MIIRKANINDIELINKIYEDIHTSEEQGFVEIGWIRGIYPTIETAYSAFNRDDLFVLEDEGQIVGSGIINKTQVDSYKLGKWKNIVDDDHVCVLHTLVISPKHSRKGYAKYFLDFYEQYALSIGCNELRIDTNARNIIARKMYEKLGYEEVGIVPTDFNGIPGIQLVLLEKVL